MSVEDVDPPVNVVYSPGDIAWVLASMALVWIMVPGVGFFYSGLLRWSPSAAVILGCTEPIITDARMRFRWYTWVWWRWRLFPSKCVIFASTLKGNIHRSCSGSYGAFPLLSVIQDRHLLAIWVSFRSWPSFRRSHPTRILCPERRCRESIYGKRQNSIDCILHIPTYVRRNYVGIYSFYTRNS